MGRNNQLRIIGGRHRGRVLRFPDAPGLRPTSSRLRETLFNWLQIPVHEARCLDLFCGSGALGLEALSRGADWVQFVDRSPKVIRQVSTHVTALGEETRAGACRADALKWLQRPPSRPFQIVFLDPPFTADLMSEACRLLSEQGWLDSRQAWVYLEQDIHRQWPHLPMDWELFREAKAGQAGCRLYRRGIMDN